KESTKKTRDEQRFWKQILTEPVCASLPAACATLSAWTGSRRRRLYGLSSTSATCSAMSWFRIISREYGKGHFMAGLIPTLDRTKIHAKRVSGRILSPRLSSRTTRSVLTSRRLAWRFTEGGSSRNIITLVLSSELTVTGTQPHRWISM